MYCIVGCELVDLIKLGGYWVGVGEIEMVLFGYLDVVEVVVVGVFDDDLGQWIVVYVVGLVNVDVDGFINFVV